MPFLQTRLRASESTVDQMRRKNAGHLIINIIIIMYSTVCKTAPPVAGGCSCPDAGVWLCCSDGCAAVQPGDAAGRTDEAELRSDPSRVPSAGRLPTAATTDLTWNRNLMFDRLFISQHFLHQTLRLHLRRQRWRND